jgi:hypothetical protein
MRTAQEDIALIGEAGLWKGERDPLLNAVILLLLYAKGRHKPLRNLHNLANAIEQRDGEKVVKFYKRLQDEVAITLTKYPDFQGTLETMAEMSDEEMAAIDRLMQDPEANPDEARRRRRHQSSGRAGEPNTPRWRL